MTNEFSKFLNDYKADVKLLTYNNVNIILFLNNKNEIRNTEYFKNIYSYFYHNDVRYVATLTSENNIKFKFEDRDKIIGKYMLYKIYENGLCKALSVKIKSDKDFIKIIRKEKLNNILYE